MPLFIDRLPFRVRPHRNGQARSPATTDAHLSVALAVLVTEPGLSSPPVEAPLQLWMLDTGKEGEASCLRCDLVAAGLNPDVSQLRPRTNRPAFGPPQTFPTRDAEIWLLSNIPALQDRPFRLELVGGIAFGDVPAQRNPGDILPLIGMQTFRQAGLQVHIDYARGETSIWTPGSLLARVALAVRRLPSGYRTVPMRWPAV